MWMERIPPAAPPLSTTCATTPTPKTMSTNVPRNSAAASRARDFGTSDLKLPEWRWHADDTSILHPEAVAFDDSQWPVFKVGSEWSTGPIWFRRWVEIPQTIAGYETQGAELRLRARISGENPVHLTI